MSASAACTTTLRNTTLKKRLLSLAIIFSISIMTACGSVPDQKVSKDLPAMPVPAASNPEMSTGLPASNSVIASTTARSNTPVVYETTAPGTKTDGNEYATIDYSNSKDGYIMVNYLGGCSKVKLQMVGPNNITYTYNLKNGYAAFPLTQGPGNYDVSVCENIEGTKYSLAFKTTLSIDSIDEFGPYLYPNQYVFFEKENKTVTKGANLAAYCSSDLEVVTNIYNYIIKNITYDYDKANTVASGYISDVDEILEIGTGICLDYAAVMTTMLRTQNIPTRLEVGYAGEVYHAWISVYIEEVGWINGVIQFNGYEWSLVDPTFGASTSEKKLKEYIGDGSNYSTKYVY